MNTPTFSSLVLLYILVLLCWSLLFIVIMKVLYLIFYKRYNIEANESTALVVGTLALCAAILATGQYDTLLLASQMVQGKLDTDSIERLGYYIVEYSLLAITLLSLLFFLSSLILRFAFGVGLAQSLKDNNRAIALLFAFILVALALLSRAHTTTLTESFSPESTIPNIR